MISPEEAPTGSPCRSAAQAHDCALEPCLEFSPSSCCAGFYVRHFGQGIGLFSSLLSCCGRAGLEAEAVVPCFQDVATVGQRRGCLVSVQARALATKKRAKVPSAAARLGCLVEEGEEAAFLVGAILSVRPVGLGVRFSSVVGAAPSHRMIASKPGRSCFFNSVVSSASIPQACPIVDQSIRPFGRGGDFR